jgi:hypothetical protein
MNGKGPPESTGGPSFISSLRCSGPLVVDDRLAIFEQSTATLQFVECHVDFASVSLPVSQQRALGFHLISPGKDDAAGLGTLGVRRRIDVLISRKVFGSEYFLNQFDYPIGEPPRRTNINRSAARRRCLRSS